MSELPIYAALLGPARSGLAPSVENLHTKSPRARGVFRVARGGGWLARLVGWVLRLPSAGASQAIALCVERSPGEERWIRDFGGQPLRSVQWREGELLIEEMNLVQCCFRLEVHDGELRFRQVGAKVGLRGWTIPLPRALWPRVEGRARGEGAEVVVAVKIEAPLVGLLVSYEGRVRPEEA